MSDLTWEELIDHLQNNPDPAMRAEAATIIGEVGPQLNTEDRKWLVGILNGALLDPHPQVLSAAMVAIGRLSQTDNIPAEEEHDDSADDIIEAASCPFCGKPEALVSPDDCEYGADCPYRR